MKLTFLILLFSSSLLAQLNLQSPENIKRFADYLYCSKDYLRAGEEYDKYYSSVKDDTIQFKSALSYLMTGDLSTASIKMMSINNRSSFYLASRDEIAKINFLEAEPIITIDSISSEPVQKLRAISELMMRDELSSMEEVTSSFKGEEKSMILKLYRMKRDAPYKSPLAAGIFSAIIPGAGKLYTGNISDGVVSFLVTSVMGYLAYDNFKAEHNTRGYLFSALTLFFHAGNIYGSVAGAQIYNAEIRYNNNQNLLEYTKQQNYFMRDYGFCK